jgi:dihydroxyacetone kinase-like predicted kinase
VVVAPGQGLTQVFESLGASVVVSGGQTMNPSTEDLFQAAEKVPTDDVIILPNNKNIVMAAEQVQTLSQKNVAVVRTITIPQGIAALLALNYQADLETNIRVMTEAAKSIETAEITTAVRSVQINGINVQEGEIIGLVNGTLTATGDLPTQVVQECLKRMHADEYEIITIYYGEAVSADEAQELAEIVGELYADQEVEVVDGGQPHYYYILSAE